MYPSGLAYRPGEKAEAEQQVRTSKGTFLGGDSSPALRWLEDKIAAVTLLPRTNGEFWNVLNYKHSQHYDSHMDSFDPKEYGPQYSQRIATVIVVLSDDGLMGGETVFKREGKSSINKPISNWTDCDADGGLKYKPRAGDAVLFWSARPDGQLDPHALHGSCPVVTGNKWVAVKWLRNKGEYDHDKP
ncbi:prolyl 4-hydroxylase [Volvox carteri f. nagariensis]|uniref:Prolyl 4-hydroxylase n=1 Tax=Volvox carteri f. nagariensis TaxID=3068 RepID=D8TKQ4_VOLCA|nr:prolyl 4-hydroxylase [Volvox carteri f. nagariensis]EFJ51926.1 prolyl 4-hydroxylase [Volvox carteri f. nagariensis]|eukprot:XP_002946700.1 prolyl 4-hydroxylase [Volvox carteri f. nagariensis]